jgi:hypothetical protein
MPEDEISWNEINFPSAATGSFPQMLEVETILCQAFLLFSWVPQTHPENL